MKLGDLKQAWVIGDYAKGKDSGLIDLVLVGEIDESFLQTLVHKAESMIQRKIRTLILQEGELSSFGDKLQLNKAIILYNKE